MDLEQKEAIFRRVFAVRDGQASKPGAWPMAQEWARRLQAPLREISLNDDPVSGADPWGEQFQASDLFVFGPDVPLMQKKNLLRETERKGAPALMLGSAAGWTSMPSRILLIDQGGPGADQLISLTAKLCEIFRVGLVALTVAPTEREARQRQRQTRETLLGCPVPVNFDYLAGVEVRSAVANVARWRRCPLVVLEATQASPWARWLGSAPGDWIMDLLDSLSFLLVPAMKPAAPVSDSTDTAAGPRAHPRRPRATSTPDRDSLVANTPHRPS